MGADLQWKNFSELRPGKTNPVLFSAEADIAVNVAQWFSQNGITAASYPRNAISKAIENKIGDVPVLLGEIISKPMMAAYVKDGTYPKELIRRPLSRSEKISFMNTLTCGGIWGYIGEEQTGGTENQFLIVDTQKHSILLNELQWRSVKDIRQNPQMAKDVLTICGSVDKAQALAAWVRKNGMHISPYSRKTSVKLDCDLSLAELDSFSRLIQQGIIPQKLSRKPHNATEVREFQEEWERNHAAPTPTSDTPPVAGEDASHKTNQIQHPCPAEESNSPAAKQQESLELKKMGEAVSLSVVPSIVSSLINDMIGTASNFKNLLEASSETLREKMENLKDIERQVTDIYHIIEFCDLNAADGFGIYKELQKILRKRRILKDEIFALDLLAGKLREGATVESLDSFIKSVKGLSSRKYRLRTYSREQIREIIHSEKILSIICDAG